MSMRMGEKIPNLTGLTQFNNAFDLYKYLGDCWGVLLFYPKNSHAVATTDLRAAVERTPQFDERGVRVVGVTAGAEGESTDDADWESHKRYCQDDLQPWIFGSSEATTETATTTCATTNGAAAIPSMLIQQQNQKMFPLVLISHSQAKDLGVLAESSTKTTTTLRTALPTNASASSTNTPSTTMLHSVTVILKPDRTVASLLYYPPTSGRMYDEIIRLLDSLQLYVNMVVATPANWQSGSPVLFMADASSVSDEEAKDLFGEEALLTHLDLHSNNNDLGDTEDEEEDEEKDKDPHKQNNKKSTSDNKQHVELPYLRWIKDPTIE